MDETNAPNNNSGQSISVLIEFKQRRNRGESVSAAEIIRGYGGKLDRDLAIDLLFAEYLDEEKAGNLDAARRLFDEFPQYSEELRKQIQFHVALSSGAESRIEISGDHASARQTPATDASQPELLDDVASANDQSPHGFRLPGFQLIKPIGRGGMGIVYLANQVALRRQVAIKLLLSGHFATKTQLARFQTEARATATLHHSNIVQIYEVGESQGQPYLVMEYVDGGSLEQYLKEATFSPRESAVLIQTLALALDEAHARGIIHRDLKPGNILLSLTTRISTSCGVNSAVLHHCDSTKSITPKIADFGLAKFLNEDRKQGPTLTIAGDLLGTPSFMAPEQASGAVVGPWTDIYSLGAIMYQLLSGSPPFEDTSAWETMQHVIHHPPARLPGTIPRDLRTICEKCMNKELLRRYASMKLLADDLERYLQDRPISARPTTIWHRSVRWCRRNRVITAAAGVVFLSLLATLMVLLWSRSSLVDMLEKTELAKQNEAISHTQSLEHLWDATLSEARALQTSRRMGQRFESLTKVRQAQNMFTRVEATEHRKAQLRDAAIAALSLPDVRFRESWHGEPWSYSAYSCDQFFDRFAQLSFGGTISITEDFGRKKIAEFPANDTRDLCLSPDGKWLAIWGEQCELIAVDDLSQRFIVTDHSHGLWTFAPSSSLLLGFDVQGFLLFNCDQQRTERLPNIPMPVVPLAISNDSRFVAIADHQLIRIVDLETLNTRCELPSPDGQLIGPSLAWHPSHRYLAAATYSNDMVFMWDIETRQNVRQFPVHGSYFNLMYDPTGQFLFACSVWGGSRILFDVETQRAVTELPNHSGEQFGISKTDGKTLLLSYPNENSKDTFEFEASGFTRTWQSNCGPEIPKTCLGISPDERWLVVNTSSGVEILDLQGPPVAILPIGSPGSGEFTFDLGNQFWLNHGGDWLRWKLVGNTLRAPQLIPSDYGWNAISVSPDGQWGLVSSGNLVRLQSFADPSHSYNLGKQLDVRQGSFRSDSRWVVTSSWNEPEGAKVWDIATKQLIKTLDAGVFCESQFSPDGQWLFTSTQGGSVWKTDDWTRHLQLNSPDKSSTGFAFAFSSDSKWCVHSSGPGILKILDLKSGKLLAVLSDPNSDQYRRVIVGPDNSVLLGTTVGRTSSIKKWDLRVLRSELEKLSIELAQLHTNDPEANEPPVEASILDRLTIESNELYEQLVSNFLYQETRPLLDSMQWQEALRRMDQALVALPDSPVLLNDLAWMLITAPREYQDAQRSVLLARRAVELRDSPQSWNTLGTAYFRLEKLDDAIDALNRSLSDSRDESSVYDLFLLAGCYAKQGLPLLANEYFNRALEAYERHRSLYSARGLRELDAFHEEIGALMQVLNQVSGK